MAPLHRLLVVLVAIAGATSCGNDGKSSSAVAWIEIDPGSLLLTPDRGTAALEAVAYDADGNQVEAAFTWTSSTPDQIEVDSAGTVSAVAELGSATVWAEADGVSSNPVVIAMVELHPGTLVVTDDQVVERGEPFLPDGAAEADFPLLDVRLRDVEVPAPGTIVVSAESSPVGGAVVSAEEDGGEVAVRLQLVSMPEMFARYEIDWQIGLTGYGVEADEEAANARQIVAAFLPIQQKIEKVWPATGPFRCSGSIAAFLEKNLVDVKLAGDAEFIFKSSRRDSSLPPGYLKVAIEGPLTLKGSIGLKAKAGLRARGKCELKTRIPIYLGAFGIVVAPAIPLGVGVSLDAKLTAATLELGFEGENGFDLGIGFECGPGTMPCRSLDKLDPINRFKPLLEVPRGMKDSRVEMSAQAYFLTGIDLIFGLRWPFEAVEVTLGPVQSANLAFVDNQMDDRGYASKYDLKLEGKLAPGEGVDRAIKKLLGEDEENGRLGADITISYPLSKSPVGTMIADKIKVLPNEKVRFTVALDPASIEYFLLGINVSAIVFYQKHGDDPFYKQVKELEVSTSGPYTWDWTATSQDAGQNEFFALVKTSLPVIELEIAADSGRKVEVTGLCVPPPGMAGLAAVPGGSDNCQLTGTASHTEVISGPDIDTTTSVNANVTLQLDPDQSLDGEFVFLPYGNWTGQHSGTVSGCTVSTAEALAGTLEAGPDQGRGFHVYSGHATWPDDLYEGDIASGLFPVTVHYECPNNSFDLMSMMDLVAFNVGTNQNFFLDPDTRRATGTYTVEGSDGAGNTTTHTFTWDLVLETPPPPPPFK